MTQPDDPNAARARIKALEAELAEWRSRADPDTLARLRSEVELEAVRHELKSAKDLYERNLAALRTEHAAEIALITQASNTHVDIAKTRAEAQLASARQAAVLAHDGRDEEIARQKALIAELTEEVEVLSTFSREKAAAHYAARVAREEASVAAATEARVRAKKEVSKARAVAQNSGMRTAADMAAIDATLARAESAYHASAEVLRECEARLARAKAKLDACR
ncbi:MAG: hypothetical protein KC776_16810 [Myxococcales bacterium]|nr:hypothetical protein [Myxococcales bacterium]MCB9575528.1 hypothetical protein [Polyangiaceae bacterium]